MKRFFKKLFKRGDFMTRADKAYYGHKFKTMFWSVFSLFIISWVGTNLVLCALTTNVQSNWDIIYEAEQPTILPTGGELHRAIAGNNSDAMYNTKIQTVTFDKYNADGKYMVGDVDVVATCNTSSTMQTLNDDVTLYRMNGNQDVYILSNKKMMANPNFSYVFMAFDGLVTVNFNNLDTSLVEDMTSLFQANYGSWRFSTINGIENWDTSNVKSMENMFNSCSDISKLDLSGWDTHNVTNMRSMFDGCKSLTTIYVGENFVVDQVQNSSYMFGSCSKLRGGQGTTYDASHQDSTYARIDGGPNSATPGYFTKKP